MNLRIAIIGTRGIPNHYGGFEQISAYLADGLSNEGHEVTVYNSHNHPYQGKFWKHVSIKHCYDPEHLIGTFGQFIYDLNCILDTRKRKFDILLVMGYSSCSIWKWLFPKNSLVIYNMDGLEWKRTKYNAFTQAFLKWAEYLAISHGNHHIADSTGIKKYLENRYAIKCKYIPYGAAGNNELRLEILDLLKLKRGKYYLLIARMEPENNIDMILEGFCRLRSDYKFIVIGSLATRHAKHIKNKYRNNENIIFTGGIFDQDILHTLRKYCSLYFHGHSVGGTNPSLLEAMSSGCRIAAHENEFNKAILGDDAFYFSSVLSVQDILKQQDKTVGQTIIANNKKKIESCYSWKTIVAQYNNYILECFAASKCKEKNAGVQITPVPVHLPKTSSI